MRGRSTQNIADVEANAIIREAHKEWHGSVVKIGAVVAILLADTEESDWGSVSGASARANGEIHGGTVAHDKKSSLGGETDYNEEFARGLQSIRIAPRVVGTGVVTAVTEGLVIF